MKKTRIIGLLLACMMPSTLTACTKAVGSGPVEPTQQTEALRTESDPAAPPDQQPTDGTAALSADVDASAAICDQNLLDGFSPEDALAYMKSTESLIIVDVAATRWYEATHFEGAINIPIEELDSMAEDELYLTIQEGCPVLLHCRRGAIVPGAYERLKELRPDIPEISYIAGAPLFDAYNTWLAEAGE